MKDRTPTYPGRVKLTPVSGQDNVYDMEMADEPIEVGTPLNKATFLTDETVSKYGGLVPHPIGSLTPGETVDYVGYAGAVPDDVFNALSPLAMYWWRKDTYEPPITESGASQSIDAAATATYFYEYTIQMDGPNGLGFFAPVNPQTITASFSTTGADMMQTALRGHWYYLGAPNPITDIYYMASDGTVTTYNNNSLRYSYSRALSIGSPLRLTNSSFVASANSSEYPENGAVDMDWYTLQGVPIEAQAFGNSKIQLVSYVGTGTSGTANPNSLTFSFAPKIVMLIAEQSGRDVYTIDYMFGKEHSTTPERRTFVMYPAILNTTPTNYHGFKNGSGNGYTYGYVSADGKTVYWYNDASTNGASEQCNISGYTYYVLAIG